MIMAPQAGNKLAASNEVLIVPDARQDNEWEGSMRDVCSRWMNYKDNSDAPMVLNPRPHGAKEWNSLKMGL